MPSSWRDSYSFELLNDFFDFVAVRRVDPGLVARIVRVTGAACGVAVVVVGEFVEVIEDQRITIFVLPTAYHRLTVIVSNAVTHHVPRGQTSTRMLDDMTSM